VYGEYKLDGTLNINEIFAGFNMWYNITAINMKTKKIDPTIDTSNTLIVEKIIANTDSIPLDQLSNSNLLIDIFMVG